MSQLMLCELTDQERAEVEQAMALLEPHLQLMRVDIALTNKETNA